MNKKVGIVSIVVGRRGFGKSTKVKNLIGDIDKPKYIYDIRGEYYSGRINTDLDKFLSTVRTKENSVIVFEEATVFFRHRSGEDMLDILTGARHRRNFIVLVFHSFRTIPVDIMELIDFIFYTQTKDRDTLIYQKFREDEDIIRIYEKSKNLNKFQFFCSDAG